MQKRCKWCGKLIKENILLEHENDCDLNDDGRSELNREMVSHKYFD